LALVVPIIVTLIYNEPYSYAFLYTILLVLIPGISGLFIKPKRQTIYARDGFAIVGLGWLLISFFGSLPFVFSGVIPSFVDAFFETSSGLTTGASIMTNVEGLPMGVMFWRSFNHWIGGMGILALTLAILPSVGVGSVQLMKAETSGPNPGKIVPRIGKSAKILYLIYVIATFIEIILLVIAGIPLYDACIHSFGTIGTGGFSVKNASVGGYNNVAAEMIIIIFMIIGGSNFALHYYALKGNIKKVFKDGEFIFYISIIAGSILLITINLSGTIYKSIWESLRYASFQVVSLMTTTGFTTADYDKWPTFSKMILFFLMFIGGCAGSTAGGIKNIRILILLKIIKRNLLKLLHPRAVFSVMYGKKAVDDEVTSEVLSYFFLYMILIVVAVLIVSMDGKDFTTTISAVVSTVSNVGPGFSMIGPSGNYAHFSDLSKVTLSFCMLVARIEIYPMLLLLVPSSWRKVNM